VGRLNRRKRREQGLFSGDSKGKSEQKSTGSATEETEVTEVDANGKKDFLPSGHGDL
jgi:hypothetical protein